MCRFCCKNRTCLTQLTSLRDEYFLIHFVLLIHLWEYGTHVKCQSGKNGIKLCAMSSFHQKIYFLMYFQKTKRTTSWQMNILIWNVLKVHLLLWIILVPMTILAHWLLTLLAIIGHSARNVESTFEKVLFSHVYHV